jgi:hypothetical protein
MTTRRYSSVRLRATVAEDLRRLTRRVAAEADRDVSQSDVLALALELAAEQITELAARVARAGRSDNDESH